MVLGAHSMLGLYCRSAQIASLFIKIFHPKKYLPQPLTPARVTAAQVDVCDAGAERGGGGRGEQCVRVAKFSKFSRRAVAGGQLRQQDQVPRSRCQAVAECAGGRKVGQLVQQSILYTVQYCTHVSTFLQLQFIIKIFLTHYIQENSVVKSLL